VTAWDRQEARAAAPRGRSGDPLEIDLTGFDGVVVSPRVPLNTPSHRPSAARRPAW
jgi:UDP-N-acetylmuramoylalanine--D-glutamate ligase